MNPFNTGSEMNDARKPSRKAPAIRATRPVVIASALVAAIGSAPGCRSAITPADSAAVAAIGPTTSCRELPTSA